MTYDKPDIMWEYLLRIEGHNVLRGPYSTEEMKAMLSNGDINEKTLVRLLSWSPQTERYEETSAWRAAGEFSVFNPHFLKTLSKKQKISRVRAGVTVIALLLIVIYFAYHSRSLHPLNPDKMPSAEDITDKMPMKPPNGKAMPREIPASHQVAPVVTQNPLSPSTATVTGIIKETNMVRRDNGLPLLTENSLLDRVAEGRIEDMLQQQYFGHMSPSGQGPAEMMQRVGYHYKVLAENIGSMSMYATDRRFIDGWMQSPGHRQNILNNEIRDIGVAVKKGIIKGQEQWVAVQIFGLQSLPVTHGAERDAAALQPRKAPNKADSSLIFRVVK